MTYFTQILLLFVLVLVTSFLATWLVRTLMVKIGVMDMPTPEGRKAHGRPVAYEGGLAIWLGILVGLSALLFVMPDAILEYEHIRAMIIGSTLIVAIGVADDIMDMRPIYKLGAQLAVGAFMYYQGFRIEKISNPFGDELIFWNSLSLAGTCLWYGLLINGINMIDGMDGLATGIVGISAVTLGAIALDMDMVFAAILCLVLLAACLGFLPFNFNPATIFMGDAGSMLLGFMLASITLLSSSKAPAFLALIIPMLAVGIPLFETCFAFSRRLLSGQHPFKADRRHLHHRFLALGFSERRTVLTFYYITAYFGVTAYVLQRLEARSTLPLVGIIIIGMLVLIENMSFLEKRSRSGLTPLGIPSVSVAEPVSTVQSAAPAALAVKRKRKRRRKHR